MSTGSNGDQRAGNGNEATRVKPTKVETKAELLKVMAEEFGYGEYAEELFDELRRCKQNIGRVCSPQFLRSWETPDVEDMAELFRRVQACKD